jgi:hypothetical protein
MFAVNCNMVARKRPLSVGKPCPWTISHFALSTHFRVALGIIALSPRTSQEGSETRVKTCQGQRSSGDNLSDSSPSFRKRAVASLTIRT